MSGEPRLYVQFIDEEAVLGPTDSLTFGRAGDLVIDDANPYLHRVVGSIDHQANLWWVTNRGTTAPITVADTAGPTQASIAPGKRVPINHAEFVIRFSAGPSHYEVEGSCDLPDEDLIDPSHDAEDTEVTLQWGVVDLNEEQHLLITALAEQQLRSPAAELQIPPSRQVARRLGWSSSKFNRKLDHLCDKFARSGVAGLRGDLGEVASERRKRLVAHALATQLVSVADLEALDRLDSRTV